MQSLNTRSVGRPVLLEYGDAEFCKLTVEVPVCLKRSIAEHAARNDRRLADEVQDALELWTAGGGVIVSACS